ncbi:MAG: DUF6599 family protein [Thermodesulfobacteriota bacterium]
MALFLLGWIVMWSGASSEAQTLESLLPKEMPEGWARIEGPRAYTKKTLFEHIDGQAELFFKYGFEKSVFAIYQNRKNTDQQVELDIYDMGNVLRAFGVFSRFRGEDRTAGIGLDSCLDDQSALFYKGRYFVMGYSTESNLSLLRRFSLEVSSRIKDRTPPPKEIGYFPAGGLKPGTVQYFPEGLLGYQFLNRGFQGTYVEKAGTKVNGKEFYLFLAVFKDSERAINALKTYRDELSKKGKPSSESVIHPGTRTLKGQDPYQGKVILLQKGLHLMGAVGFEEEEYAENLLTELMRNIR